MISKLRESRRGIVLTLDISIAMMVLLAVIALAYASYGSSTRAAFDDQLMRSYLQDAATVMSSKGYLSAPIDSENGTNTTGIREVLRATPSTVCMQVSGFGTAVGSDLGGYWKFDEDSGTVVSDSSGNGLSGTISGGSTLNSLGKSGHAITLDGLNGSVQVASAQFLPLMGNAYSFALWIKDDTPASTLNSRFHRIIAFANGTSGIQLGLGTDVPGTSRIFYIQESSGSSARQVTSGNVSSGWHHVVATSDGANWHMYLDGNLSDGGTGLNSGSTAYLNDTGYLYIGQRGNNDSTFVNGSIDEVRIYDRALTADEVKLVYSNPSNILYVVDKPECAFSGGEVQSLTVPFVSNVNQEENIYYYATLRAWLSGASK